MKESEREMERWREGGGGWCCSGKLSRQWWECIFPLVRGEFSTAQHSSSVSPGFLKDADKSKINPL